MNLYKIEFIHASLKDVEYGIKCLLIANDDNSVYEWIKSEPHIKDHTLFNSWKESEKDEFNVYDDEYNIVGIESFKDIMLRMNGEMNDDNYDFSDAYYGITLLGWSLVMEMNLGEDSKYSELVDNGIVFYA